MTKDEKNQLIEALTEQINNNDIIYIADTSELNAEKTSSLRRLCFSKNITLTVVKNTLLKRAMEQSNKNLDELYSTLKGPSSLMFGEAGNAPAKLIKEFRKTSDKPILKGAWIQEATYLGDDQISVLASLKSKNELIADIIALLQSPAKNVIGALQSGGQNISGILQTLSERSE
jgi:large subunit ribosomal protein L10